MARRRRHTPEQIIRKLREADRLLGEGADVAQFPATWRCRSRPITGGATSSAACKPTTSKRLKDLERENSRLTRIVADKELEIYALGESADGNW